MNAGGRADSSPGRAVTLSVFLFAASTATLGHGAPKPPNAPESTAPIASTRPQDDSLDAPRPPFVVTTEVTVASSVEFGASGGTTMHHLAIDAPPFDTGTLELTADGAFGTTIDRALASAEGVIDTEAAAAGADCRPAAGRTVIPAGDFDRITADGTLDVTVRNSASVQPRCATNRHTVRLRYETIASRLELAPTRTGSSTALAVALHARGTHTPITLRLASDRAAFTPVPASLVLAPEASGRVAIRFAPSQPGTLSGTLTITADGFATPVRLPLTGQALDRPLVGVHPGSLDVTLPVGFGATRAIQLTNQGATSIDLVASVEGRAGQATDPACATPAVYVLEGVSSALARIDLHTGAVAHLGPEIFGASALALSADGAGVYVTTFLGEVYWLDTTTGNRSKLADGAAAIHDAALSPDGLTLFLLHRDTGAIERLDRSSLTRSPFIDHLQSPTGLDVTPDGRSMFVATAAGLLRVDIPTASIAAAYQEFPDARSPRFDPQSGLVYFRSDATGEIDALDPVTRETRAIATVGGSASAPFVLANRGGLAFGADKLEQTLSVLDLADGRTTLLTSDLTSVRDLEARADAECLGTFLSVEPAVLTLSPQETATVVARFSTVGTRPGLRSASVRFREAGQSVVVTSLDATLMIEGAPHLVVQGAPRTVELVSTTRVPLGRGSMVTFDLPVHGAPTGPGTLAITTEASLGGATGVVLEGTSLGSDSNPQCVRTTRSHDVSSTTLAAAAADGIVGVRLDLADLEDFAVPCGGDRFTARLIYPGPADTIEFGDVPAGDSATLAPTLRNLGDQPLLVSGISTSGAGFTVPMDPVSLAPGGSFDLPVTFAAGAAGDATGTLRLETNDPASPLVEIDLAAHVTDPPVLSLTPSQLAFETTPGGSASSLLTLNNDGGTPLDYRLNLTSAVPGCPAAKLVNSALKTIDLATLETASLPQNLSGPGQRYGMSATPDGGTGFVVVGANLGGVFEVDLATGDNTRLRGLLNALAVAVEPGGLSVLVTDAAERLYRLDRVDRTLDPIGSGPLGGHVAVDATGRLAFLTARTGELRSLDLASGAMTTITSDLSAPQGIVLSADGATAYVVDEFSGPGGERLVRIDLATGAITPILSGLHGAEEIALDPSGLRAYVSEERDRRTLAVDLATGQTELLAESASYGMATLPDPGCSGAFVKLPPGKGQVAPHSMAPLSLKAVAGDLPPGHYTATLEVRGNDPQRPLSTIPIAFDVLPDVDADGFADRDDNCPAVANADQADGDGDRTGDLCDNCPAVSNPGQADVNNDGAGDACQPGVAFLEVRQDGGAFIVVRLSLADPLGRPLTGTVDFLDAEAGPAPSAFAPTSGQTATTGAAAGSATTAPQRPSTGGRPAGITASAVRAAPVLSIAFSGRPPRRIDLAALLAAHAYRLRVGATDGTTPPFVAETVFQHQTEGTLAFNEPPVARIAALPQLECDRPGGALASLIGNASSDADSTAATTDDIADYEWTLDPGSPGARSLGHAADLSAFLPLGAHTVSLKVTDRLGESSEVSAPVSVADTRPPEITLAADPAVLFPPNHDLVPVRLVWQVSDVCDPAPASAFAGASSSEPDDAPGSGDGATIGDIGAPMADAASPSRALLLPLRAERAAGGAGRVYEIRLRATDGSGNAAPAVATVVVPHDLGHGPEPLLLQVERDPVSAGTKIYWPAVGAGTVYDVISGDLAAWRVEDRTLRLGGVRVLARGLTATSLVDPAPPPPRGRAVVYLIQARAEGLVRGYGTESAPWPRVPTSCDGGCP